MRQLVPVMVRIGLQANGHAAYPPFNTLPSVRASGLDWSIYVDQYGAGWHYDAKSGHKDAIETPYGEQAGCLLVPSSFAAEAVAAWPDRVSRLTPAEFETFYDTRAAYRMPSEITDQKALERVNARNIAGQPLSSVDRRALDANSPEPGIRANPRKTWATRRVVDDIELL